MGSVNTASVLQVDAIHTSTCEPFGFLHKKVCGAPSGNNLLFRVPHPTSIQTHASAHAQAHTHSHTHSHTHRFVLHSLHISTIPSLLLKLQGI